MFLPELLRAKKSHNQAIKAAAFVYTGAAVFALKVKKIQGFCFCAVVVQRLAGMGKMR